MRVVLATGIYPPDIGGPATYVAELAKGLSRRGVQVTVMTYGSGQRTENREQWTVVVVPKHGGPIARWMRYAKALREQGKDADIVYCFSSISCGVPLFLSHLRGPKRLLRLGGDFAWERYTDRGGQKSLREWYASRPWSLNMMNGLLRQFDHIVFSTPFQEELFERSYTRLPLHGVIENALPAGQPVAHAAHTPFRLLSFGRFVPFKNLGSLIQAMTQLTECTLTIVGDGPLSAALHALVEQLPKPVRDRTVFRPPVRGIDRQRLFIDHDLLVIPSLTDISPNAALEARTMGLPVLLTEQTGLSTVLADGAILRDMRTPQAVARAVEEARDIYPQLSERAAAQLPVRGWEQVCEEHMALFRSIV